METPDETKHTPTPDFEPFGPEWVKEVTKRPKAFIIEMWGKAGKENDQLKASNADLKAQVEELKETKANVISGLQLASEELERLSAELTSLRPSYKAMAESHAELYELLKTYAHGGMIDYMHDDWPCPDEANDAIVHAELLQLKK